MAFICTVSCIQTRPLHRNVGSSRSAQFLAKPDSILAVYGARVAKGSAGRTQRAASPSSGRKDSDGRQVRNFILSTLPEKEWAQIDSSLEFVRLRLHQVLHETGETIKSGYFLNDGLGSVLTTEPNGKTVEVGLIGNEGFVGLPIIFGFKTIGLRVVTRQTRRHIGLTRPLCSKSSRNAPSWESIFSVFR